jgi:hypothetical protein
MFTGEIKHKYRLEEIGMSILRTIYHSANYRISPLLSFLGEPRFEPNFSDFFIIALWYNISDMKLKRRIIIALDAYEDLPSTSMFHIGGTKRHEGITQGSFIKWFREQRGNDKYDYETLDKAINDSAEDHYINKKIAWGEVENILVSSTGRDLKKWTYYFFAVLNRMGAERLVIEGILIIFAAIVGYWIH